VARRRRVDPARAADEALLAQRLADAGLRGRPIVAHENRSVMVHLTRDALRVHRGFVYAPDRVLRAIVTFLRAPRQAIRRAAERELLAFPVHAYVPPRAPRRAPQPSVRLEDGPVLAALATLHAELNRAHFGGRLSRPTFRLSRRMRRRLGEVLEPGLGASVQIGISRRHLERDGWDEVRRTLLHEMVHQWQVETGLPLDHGRAFRQKARDVGVEPSSRRRVG
jgi:hypothetical protein